MRWYFGMLGLFLLLLSGCNANPRHLGFSEQEWQAFSPKEKEQLLAQYVEHKHHHGVDHFDHLPEGAFSEVTVSISGGDAVLWPDKKRAAFKPVKLKLGLGDCKDVALKGDDYKTVLHACYGHGTLRLDPSRWDANYLKGGLVLHQNGLWRFGSIYPSVYSHGYADLKAVRLEVRGAYDG